MPVTDQRGHDWPASFSSRFFETKFPFAYIDLADDDIPLKVQLTGWSPFIPTDEHNSSLPFAAIEYSFVNKGSTPVDAVFSFNTKKLSPC